jgi:hypothetical protein
MYASDKDLFKRVKKVKVSNLLPGFSAPPGFDHVIVDENNNILNFCSGRYSLVNNSTILKPIESYLKTNNIDYIKKVKIINGSKFYVDYIIKTRKDTENVKGIFPKISIWNSYDGGSTMRHEMGFYRLICSNGLTRPEGEVKKKSFKHAVSQKTNKTDTQEKILKILMDIKSFIDGCSLDIQKFEDMTKVKVTKAKIDSIANHLKLSKKIVECAKERYDLETKEGVEYINEYGEVVKSKGCEKNLFTLYNALNYGIYNTNLKELPEKKIEKDKELINYLLKEI